MNFEYDYIQLINYGINLNRKVLMIRINSDTFNNDNLCRDIVDRINQNYSAIDGNDIVIVFAVNDSNQHFSYKGDSECYKWLSKRKYDSNEFHWSRRFPDITHNPRPVRV